MIKIGIIGMGGFAGSHQNAVYELEKQGLCKLICTCDPNPSAFEVTLQETLKFKERGIQIFTNYLDMLEAYKDQLDVVTIPTPLPLHAQMHKDCVERGLAVYLEKPPSLYYKELEEMIEVEKSAKLKTNVGFNFIIEEHRQSIKKRIIAGEFGKIKRVSFCGMWPRSFNYFVRNNWGGKLKLNGKYVLDYCLGNAMAHYAHNVLFWAGTDELFDWAKIEQVQAEIYRAHDIQSADTVFAKAMTSKGIELDFALTHACAGEQYQLEKVECENAIIEYNPSTHYKIVCSDGKIEEASLARTSNAGSNIKAYLDYVEGRASRPLTRLEDCRPFTALCDLVYVASGTIHNIPKEVISYETEGFLDVKDIRDIAAKFIAEGLFPSQQGVSWSQPFGTAAKEDIGKLEGIIDAMVPDEN